VPRIGTLSAAEETEFRDLEQRLSTPATPELRATLSRLLASGFRAVGSTGQVSDAKAVLDSLVAAERPRVFEEFTATLVAEGAVLVTYISRSWWEPGWQPPVRRSSLWVRRDERWQLLFRQGTRLPAETS
jgi:hypothetical protein